MRRDERVELANHFSGFRPEEQLARLTDVAPAIGVVLLVEDRLPVPRRLDAEAADRHLGESIRELVPPLLADAVCLRPEVVEQSRLL